MKLLAVGIFVLVVGVVSMIWGSLWYFLASDTIQDEQCGENKVKSTITSGAATVTEYYPSCPDPVQGGMIFGIGAATLAGGIIMIIKSRKTIISKA